MIKKDNEILKNRNALSKLSKKQVKHLVHQYQIDARCYRKDPFKIDTSIATGVREKPIIKHK